jgi:hypothetical protein
MDRLLRLKHLSPVATGRERHVFIHPDDPDLIVKVVTADYVHKRSRAGDYYGRWYKNFTRAYLNFIRVGPFIGFLRETREQLAVIAAEGKIPRRLQSIVGLVATDMGVGLVSRAVRDADGALAPNLTMLVEQDRFDATARQKLDEFCQWLLDSAVVIADLNPGNLLYGYEPVQGHLFVMVDGIGEKNFIPIHSISRRFNRASKLRRIHRLRQKIARLEARRRGDMGPVKKIKRRRRQTVRAKVKQARSQALPGSNT